MMQHWKIAAALAGVIACSALIGGIVGHSFARRNFEARNDPANWNEHVSREFDRIVKPSPEQAGRIQGYLDEAVRELHVIRQETIARSTNVIWRLVGRVEQELTPAQREAFEALKPKPADLTLEVLQVKPEKSSAPPN